MKQPTALAIDLGSSTGRVISGTLTESGITTNEIYRFSHQPVCHNDQLIWDVGAIWAGVQKGISLAVKQCDNLVSLSVDTWGVDFAVLDNNWQLISPIVCYRDERTTRTLTQFQSRINDQEVFRQTGIAPATINTANQLFALLTEQPELAAKIAHIVLLPDYFAFLLSGIPSWSRSICSTGAWTTPGAKGWNSEIFEILGINSKWVGELNDELNVIGNCRLSGAEKIKVVRAGAHDSACAVHSLDRNCLDESYFLVSGSWSVLGITTNSPIMTKDACNSGITNEVRTDGGIRCLLNLTGLWILQECQRQWAQEGHAENIRDLINQARQSRSCGLICPDDPVFDGPNNMVSRVKTAIESQGGVVSSRGELVRTVLESFANRYAEGIRELTKLSGIIPKQLHLMGGGSRNDLLCELTSCATGLEVIAGPAEASTLGSLLAQFEILEYIDPTDRSDIIVKSANTAVYTPKGKYGSTSCDA